MEADGASAAEGGEQQETGGEFPLFHSLVAQLESDDPAVRQAACWTLGQLRYTPAVKRLSRILSKEEDCLVRAASAQSLSLIGGAPAAQALIRGLRDEDDLVVDSCILGLGSLGDTQGLLPLEEMLRKLRNPPEDLVRRIEWAIRRLKAVDDPGKTPDRRRGGVSKKIRRYLEKVHAAPRDGIAHNNLAVAYFHAAEFDLAVRHCLLAKELGARVHWLWGELEKAGHAPGDAELSDEDRKFLENESAGLPGAEDSGSVRLEPEPVRVEIKRSRPPADQEPGPYRVPVRKPAPGPYRVSEHRKDGGDSEGGEGGDRRKRNRRGRRGGRDRRR